MNAPQARRNVHPSLNMRLYSSGSRGSADNAVCVGSNPTDRTKGLLISILFAVTTEHVVHRRVYTPLGNVLEKDNWLMRRNSATISVC